MMSKKLTALAAVLLSIVLMLTLCAFPAFAEEAATGDTAESVTTATTEAGTEAGTDKGTETGATTNTKETTTGKVTETDTTDESIAAAEKKEDTTRLLVNLGVGAAILIALAVLCIKFRDKIPGWVRALKAECKKISWCSKDKLKKNTIVVVIIILVVALAIAILDFAFSEGLKLLGQLF